MYRSMSYISPNVVESKYNLVWSNHRHLATNAIPIPIYMGAGRLRGDWSTGENSNLNSIVMSRAMCYRDMGRPNSSRCDLRRSRRSKVTSVARHPTILRSSIGYMILASSMAPNMSRQEYHRPFFLPCSSSPLSLLP